MCPIIISKILLSSGWKVRKHPKLLIVLQKCIRGSLLTTSHSLCFTDWLWQMRTWKVCCSLNNHFGWNREQWCRMTWWPKRVKFAYFHNNMHSSPITGNINGQNDHIDLKILVKKMPMFVLQPPSTNYYLKEKMCALWLSCTLKMNNTMLLDFIGSKNKN